MIIFTATGDHNFMLRTAVMTKLNIFYLSLLSFIYCIIILHFYLGKMLLILGVEGGALYWKKEADLVQNKVC